MIAAVAWWVGVNVLLGALALIPARGGALLLVLLSVPILGCVAVAVVMQALP